MFSAARWDETAPHVTPPAMTNAAPAMIARRPEMRTKRLVGATGRVDMRCPRAPRADPAYPGSGGPLGLAHEMIVA